MKNHTQNHILNVTNGLPNDSFGIFITASCVKNILPTCFQLHNQENHVTKLFLEKIRPSH